MARRLFTSSCATRLALVVFIVASGCVYNFHNYLLVYTIDGFHAVEVVPRPQVQHHKRQRRQQQLQCGRNVPRSDDGVNVTILAAYVGDVLLLCFHFHYTVGDGTTDLAGRPLNFVY